MALDAFPSQATGSRGGLFSRLFSDGLRVMRERWVIYALFAALVGASTFEAFHHSSLLERAAYAPLTLIRYAPINVILVLSLIAIFFVLPSALRRYDDTFTMTPWRAALTIAMIVSVGLVTEIGYAAAVVPGIIVGVLLSQTILAALLQSPERGSASNAVGTIVASMRESFRLTRVKFVSTTGVVVLSLAMVVIPSFIVGLAMLMLDKIDPRTLTLTAPLLFLTFIYCECVRYTLVVRWYARLRREEAPGE